MTVTQAELEWESTVSGGQSECLWRRNQWLVPNFDGVQKKTGSRDSQDQTTSRCAKVEDAEQLQQLISQEALLLKSFQDSQKPAATVPVPDAPQVDARAADQVQSAKPTDYIMGAITREVVVGVPDVRVRHRTRFSKHFGSVGRGRYQPLPARSGW